jgi:hypothetical protein
MAESEGEGMKITAQTITDLLAQKHHKDVFVPECSTNGQTAGHYQRMDAWAMVKSWARPMATAYEIKVTRSDFIQDDKWPGYLAYCNAFYFVCPHGLIQLEELPENVGLMYVSKTGTRLYTKRKAPRRDVDIPERLWRYLLFSRTRVVDYALDHESYRKQFWKKWVKGKAIDRDFGHHVSKSIRRTVADKITSVQDRNNDLLVKMGEYDNTLGLLREFGLVDAAGNITPKWDMRGAIRKLTDAVPIGLITDVRTAYERIGTLLTELNRIKQEGSV